MPWDEHLAYEIDQMCNDMDLLYEYWVASHGATPTDLAEEARPYFEAALVHMRNLLELLVRCPTADPSALWPEDFGARDWDYEAAQHRFVNSMGEPVDYSYGRICSYVSHLSKDRDLGPPKWEPQPLRDVLLAEAQRFLDEVEANGGSLPGVRAILERRT